MKLYVANFTQQSHMFTYRVPDEGGPIKGGKLRGTEIRAGGQVALPGDFSHAQIDAIIDQYAKYGLASVPDVLKMSAFSGLAYSIDKPVTVDAIRRGLIKNSEALREQGIRLRQEAGVAAFENAEQRADAANIGLRQVEMSVIEEQPERHEGMREGPPIAEGVRVNRTADPADEPAPTRRGRPRRAA